MNPHENPAQPKLTEDIAQQTFSEPWQAQAFALTIHLYERGLFTWPEWAECLSQEIAAAGDQEYYASWLKALETMLADKGIAAAGLVEEVTEAWHRAAHATAHGDPILLENDPGEG